MDQFLTQELQSVFGTDGLGTSHPIYIPVYNPEEINEIFDKISYSKVSFPYIMSKQQWYGLP